MAVSGCLALQVAVSVALRKIHQEALQRALLLLLAALQSVAVSGDRPSVPPSPISTSVFGLSNNLTLYWVLFGLKQPPNYTLWSQTASLPSIFFGLKHFQLYSVYNALLGASITLIALSAQGCIHTMIFSYRNGSSAISYYPFTLCIVVYILF